MEEKSTQKPILIAGTCSLEGYESAVRHAEKLAELSDKYGYDFIYKGSFDKANRTSIKSERGVGIVEGYQIFSRLKHDLGIKITTDIHEPRQAEFISSVVDVLQIPAFLCRQTDLISAAARTGCTVNIKKGQMIAGEDMKYAAEKVEHDNVLLTERGSMFGIRDLVVDFTQVVDMQSIAPVILDCTHSTNPEYSGALAKCGKALGVRGLFFEVHEDPEKAWSDGGKSIPLNKFENILKQL